MARASWHDKWPNYTTLSIRRNFLSRSDHLIIMSPIKISMKIFGHHVVYWSSETLHLVDYCNALQPKPFINRIGSCTATSSVLLLKDRLLSWSMGTLFGFIALIMRNNWNCSIIIVYYLSKVYCLAVIYTVMTRRTPEWRNSDLSLQWFYRNKKLRKYCAASWFQSSTNGRWIGERSVSLLIVLLTKLSIGLNGNINSRILNGFAHGKYK